MKNARRSNQRYGFSRLARTARVPGLDLLLRGRLNPCRKAIALKPPPFAIILLGLLSFLSRAAASVAALC